MNPYAQGHSMPGMEFFQSMLKGASLPTGFASWMVPTMDPQELEQKITDLKSVLQWLEANARLTQATIQALEVQRMTLAALKTMNVDLGSLGGRMAEAMQAGAQSMGAPASNASVDASVSAPSSKKGGRPGVDAESLAEEEPTAAAREPTSPLPGMMDPMQWWNAVSQQFTQVATQALGESPWPMPKGVSTPTTAADGAATPPPHRGARKSSGKPASVKAAVTPRAASKGAQSKTGGKAAVGSRAKAGKVGPA